MSRGFHVVEVVGELPGRPNLVSGSVLETAPARTAARRVASDWVDGARGLLVRTYRTDRLGLLSGAIITTPTAQNEGWLTNMLLSSLRAGGPIDLDGDHPARLQVGLEAAVREADPYLPCTSLPLGHTQVRLRVTGADGKPGAAPERS